MTLAIQMQNALQAFKAANGRTRNRKDHHFGTTTGRYIRKNKHILEPKLAILVTNTNDVAKETTHILQAILHCYFD